MSNPLHKILQWPQLTLSENEHPQSGLRGSHKLPISPFTPNASLTSSSSFLPFAHPLQSYWSPGKSTSLPGVVHPLGFRACSSLGLDQCPHLATWLLSPPSDIHSTVTFSGRLPKHSLQNCNAKLFPGGPVAKTLEFPMQRAQVQSLARELYPHAPTESSNTTTKDPMGCN